MPRADRPSSWLSYVLRWPTTTSRDWAVDALPQLCANPGVTAVVLLGSTVRPAESSYDLDCLYVFRGMRPSIPAAPVDVDMRGFDAAQVDQLIAGGNDLLVWSIKFGRLVCERDSFWTTLRNAWKDRLPFPSAEVADLRAEKAEQLLAGLREIGDQDAVAEQLVTALTHRARAALLRRGVFPASRPELPEQLRLIDVLQLADRLDAAIRDRNAMAHLSAVARQ